MNDTHRRGALVSHPLAATVRVARAAPAGHGAGRAAPCATDRRPRDRATARGCAVSTYHRAQHAAHYGYGHPATGHDLESWDVAQAVGAARPSDVPADAAYHHGYVADGVQHVVWTRVAPLTGDCPSCARRREALS